MKKNINNIKIQKEDARLQALIDYNILDTPEEESFDRITRLASLVCGTPISLISLSDSKRQWFKSKLGIDIKEIPREISFCNEAIKQKTLYEVKDTNKDQLFKNNPLVKNKPKIKFYAAEPLIDSKGNTLGTLCVKDTIPNELNETQSQALKLLAKEATSLIVDRRKKEENRYFGNLFLLTKDLICIFDKNGFFKKTNPAFKSTLKWKSDELLNKSFFDFIHPDDIQNSIVKINKLNKKNQTVNFTHRFKQKNGHYRTLQWGATLEPSTGSIFANARDITEDIALNLKLIASEKKLKSFFENSQGLMYTHDLNGQIISLNKSGADTIGYSNKELKNLTLYDLTPKENLKELENYLDIIKNEKHFEGQMTLRSKNGKNHDLYFSNVLQSNEHNELYVIGNAVDISDRFDLEKDLKATKNMLERTNQVSRVGGWEIDLTTNKIHWTKITKQIHEVAPDFIPTHENAMSFYKKGKSRTTIVNVFKNAIKNGTSWDKEIQITTQKGNEIWCKAVGEPEIINGQCVRIHGTFQNINKRKIAEIKFKESKKLLDDIVNAATQVSIISTDTKGTITLFNKGAQNLLGFTSLEMVGKKNYTNIHCQTEISKRSIELNSVSTEKVEGFDVFIQLAKKSGIEHREWKAIKKDGTNLTVSLAITPIKKKRNKIIGYVAIATNITKRKEIENDLLAEKERLSAFVKHTPAAVAMLDNKMQYIEVSKKWIDNYHLKRENIIGKPYSDSNAVLGKSLKKHHHEILTKGTIHNVSEDEYVSKKSGEIHSITWIMRPWYTFDKKIGGMMILTKNINSIIKQKKELKKSKKLAEQANVAKSEFLANMSHEIRTPLNGVIGFTDLVLKTKLSETQQQYLNIVNQSANGLLNIINDILDFSKIESGKLDLDISKCDLYDIGAHATDIVNYQIQKKNLEILLNISPDIPRYIWADSIRLKQIIINLLGNATKFTEKGEVELKIEVLNTDENLKTLRFSVTDTGVGIAYENQQKIFDAFSQEDASTTKKYGGTGLGLTISNKLLLMMNSKLQLNSTPNKGSTFYFDVTFKTEHGKESFPLNIDTIKNVLIVDDNKNNRSILSKILSIKNIQSDEAENGFEALQILGNHKQYDVIIMDNHMPYMNGIETIQKIRESFYSISSIGGPSIVLYSSSKDPNITRNSKELGVFKRLTKPVKSDDIYLVLSEIYKQKSTSILTNDSTKDSSLQKKLAILIIEDNSVNRFLAKTIIQKQIPNAIISEAVNGKEGVHLTNENKFDLILMDIQMPIMNGYEATKEIRSKEKDSHTPIIAVTAGNVKGEKEKCLNVGMDGFLVKPIIERQLIEIFDKWLPKENKNTNELDNTKDHFDINQLKSYYGDDAEALKQVQQLVKEQLDESVIALKTNIENNDLEGLQQVGHKLRGTTSTAGMNQLSIMATQLEQIKSLKEINLDSYLESILQEINFVKNLMI